MRTPSPPALALVALAALAALARLAGAHTVFTTLYVDGRKQGDGTCIRNSRDLAHASFPVTDLASASMACGVGGGAESDSDSPSSSPVFTCPAPAGGKLTFEFRKTPSAEGGGFIDPSHVGPAAVYARRLVPLPEDASEDDGRGKGGGEKGGGGGGWGKASESRAWFKLWSEGYDAEADKWATEKIMDDGGFLSVEIPPGLPAGPYLFRPEAVALHSTGRPQVYTGCAQVYVESAVAPTSLLRVPADRAVSIPGYVGASDRSMTYNVYSEEEFAPGGVKTPYPQPGPEAWAPPPPPPATAGKGGAGKIYRQADDVAANGGVPGPMPPGSSRCLIKNANWCAAEVPPYSDAAGCWAAGADCWRQNEACWGAQTAGTGGRNCRVWEAKCRDLNRRCQEDGGEHRGPPPFRLVDADWPAPESLPPAKNAGVVAAAAAAGEGAAAAAAEVPATGDGDGEKKKEEEEEAATAKTGTPAATAEYATTTTTTGTGTGTPAAAAATGSKPMTGTGTGAPAPTTFPTASPSTPKEGQDKKVEAAEASPPPSPSPAALKPTCEGAKKLRRRGSKARRSGERVVA